MAAMAAAATRAGRGHRPSRPCATRPAAATAAPSDHNDLGTVRKGDPLRRALALLALLSHLHGDPPPHVAAWHAEERSHQQRSRHFGKRCCVPLHVAMVNPYKKPKRGAAGKPDEGASISPTMYCFMAVVIFIVSFVLIANWRDPSLLAQLGRTPKFKRGRGAGEGREHTTPLDAL